MSRRIGKRKAGLPDEIWDRVHPIIAAALGPGSEVQGKDLAEHLGVSRPAVSSWLNDKSRPTMTNLVATLQFLGVDPMTVVPEFYQGATRDKAGDTPIPELIDRAFVSLSYANPARASSYCMAAMELRKPGGLAFHRPEQLTVQHAENLIRLYVNEPIPGDST